MRSPEGATRASRPSLYPRIGAESHRRRVVPFTRRPKVSQAVSTPHATHPSSPVLTLSLTPMIRQPSRRTAVTGAMLLLLAACQGGDTTVPSESSDPGGAHSAGQAPVATPGDTTHTAPATPAPSPSADTGRTPTPPPSASTFRVTVYVGAASPGTDTLHSTPVVNAHVTVLRRTFTRTTGPDTLTVTETPVASGTTDALGNASFGNLPAANYRLEAVAEGLPGSPASIQIAPPYPSDFSTWIIFRASH